MVFIKSKKHLLKYKMAIDKDVKIREIERELFKMVYDWGRVGVITDELCIAFQDKLEEYRNSLAPNQLKNK